VWGNLRNYTVSLLKAWWGDAATEENEPCFQYLPRINGDHSHDAMMLKMLDGGRRACSASGQNPAVGSANSKLMRLNTQRLLQRTDSHPLRDWKGNVVRRRPDGAVGGRRRQS
jgi:formate dehydrogenase major subunit